jgi:hypothetical protein
VTVAPSRWPALVPPLVAAFGTIVICWISIPLSESLGFGSLGVAALIAVLGLVLAALRTTRSVGLGVLSGVLIAGLASMGLAAAMVL